MAQRKFEITSPAGKKYVVELDRDPTEEDFKKLSEELGDRDYELVDQLSGVKFDKESPVVIAGQPPVKKSDKLLHLTGDEREQKKTALGNKLFSVPEFISKPVSKFAEAITDPNIPDIPYMTSFNIGRKNAGPSLKGLTAGMTEGASGMLTPMNAAFVGLGSAEALAAEKALPELWNFTSQATRALSVPIAAEGVDRIIRGKDFSDRAQGVAEVAMGALGLRNRGVASRFGEKPVVEPPVESPPQKLLPAPSPIEPGPRFYAGKAGIADAMNQHLYETGKFNKIGPLVEWPNEGAIPKIVEGSSGEQVGSPSVLPSELPTVTDVGPIVAASGQVPTRPFPKESAFKPVISEAPVSRFEKKTEDPEVERKNYIKELNNDKSLTLSEKRKKLAHYDKLMEEGPEIETPAEMKAFGGDNLFKGSEGRGLSTKKSFEEQWQNSINEAKILGIDISSYDNLDELQWDITRKTAIETMRTGKNPLVEAVKRGELPAEMASGPLDPELDWEDQKRMIKTAAAAHRGKAAREAIQNATDAAFYEGRAGKVDIIVEPYKSITISDDGPGLTRNELETVYIKPYKSGKAGLNTAGKIGIGKSSYLYASKGVEVTSRVREGGQLKEYFFKATPDQLLDKSVYIEERNPTGSNTGVTLKYDPPEEYMATEDEIRPIIRELQHPNGIVSIHSKSGGKAANLVERIDLSQKSKNLKKYRHDFEEFRLDIKADTTELTDQRSQAVTIHVSSFGMPHNEANFEMKAPYVPKDIYIDLKPKFGPEDYRFPFNIDRTYLKYDAKNKIKKILFEKITKQGIETQVQHLKDLWDQMPKFKNVKGPVDFFLSDEENYLGPEMKDLVLNSPAVNKLAQSVSNVVQIINQRLISSESDIFEPYRNMVLKRLVSLPGQTNRIGFRFSNPNKGRWGVNIPDPTNLEIKEGAIDSLLSSLEGTTNPKAKYGSFIDIPQHLVLNPTPERLVYDTFSTLVHELAHNLSRKEGGPQAIVINGILKETINQYAEIEKELQRGYYDESGRIEQDLLAILDHVSKSDGQEFAPGFSLTGIGQESTSSNGRGKSKANRDSINKRPEESLAPKSVVRVRAVNKLTSALRKVQELRNEQEEIYTQEKGERVSRAAKIKATTFSGLKKQLGKLSGEYEKVEFQPISLNPQDAKSLMELIDSADLDFFETLRAKIALCRIVGDVEGLPPQNEIDVLKAALKGGIQDDEAGFVDIEGLEKLLDGTIKTASEPMNLLYEVGSFSRQMMASTDLSFPFRQGLGLVHTREFWKNFGNTLFQAARSQKFYENTMAAIESDPDYPMLVKAGIKFTDLTDYTKREEYQMSKFAEKLPWVHISNRANSAFINKLRLDVGKRLFKLAKVGFQPDQLDPETGGLERARFDNVKRAKDLAEYINVATGRASLGKLEQAAVPLSMGLFAVRLGRSRMKMLSPLTYVKSDPFVRKQYLKSLLAMISFGGMILGLSKWAGADVETNPSSADFMKAKFRNTRLDPFGGLQQFAVWYYRLITGNMKSTTTGHEYDLNSGRYGSPTKKSISYRFIESKMSPLFSFIATYLEGKDFRGLPINVQKELLLRFIPIIAQDLYDVAMDSPELVPLQLLELFGMSVNTYGADENANPFVQ